MAAALLQGVLLPGATAYLEAAFSFWAGLPFLWVFAGHCLYVALGAPELRDRFAVHYLMNFLWGNGGGVVTSLLMQSPSQAPLSFFSSDRVLGTWTACWWAINYCPGGLPRALALQWPVRLVLRGCTALLRALLIVQRVDLAAKLYPGVAAAPLILGTLAGCGGRLYADAILSGWHALRGNAELSTPGHVSRSAALAAASYYVLAHATDALPAAAAAGLVVSALMLHSVLSSLTGLELDFTEPLSRVVHAVTFVPLPPPQPVAAIVAADAEEEAPRLFAWLFEETAVVAAAAPAGDGRSAAATLWSPRRSPLRMLMTPPKTTPPKSPKQQRVKSPAGAAPTAAAAAAASKRTPAPSRRRAAAPAAVAANDAAAAAATAPATTTRRSTRARAAAA